MYDFLRFREARQPGTREIKLRTREAVMEFASQLKKYRTEKGMSQEELAEEIFVSRQTVSNWETEKSYPDVHSLLLLSSLFGVSLDQLIKGDLEIMKKEISRESIQEFNKWGNLYAILLLLIIISAVPLFVFLEWKGVAIYVCLYVIAMYVARKVEKLKKENNLDTYKEIVAFKEGRTLDELEQAKEKAKAPYAKVLLALASAGATLVVGVILGAIIWVAKTYFGLSL